MFINRYVNILIGCFFLITCPSMTYASCSCGCNCESPCNCGCAEGKECDCKQPCPCGCKCESPCNCGCADGKECNCKQSSDCDCGCPHPCNCGCEAGGECNCNQQLNVSRVFDGPCCDYSPDCCFDVVCGYCDGTLVMIPGCLSECDWAMGHCVYQGPYSYIDCDAPFTFCCGSWGSAFPEDPPLFRPFVADPRQVCYSVGWRFDDQALGKNLIPVSFGDNFPIMRWCGVCPWGGMLQLNLEGALWAVFNPCQDSAPLINADYYVGIPIDYAIGRWAFRLRGYHISSHIGDEFLLNHPHFDRRNPSAEYLDGYVSYYLDDDIRLYGGLGWVIQHDESFNQGHFYAETGAELRLYQLGFFDPCQHLYGTPIYAMHFKYQDAFKRHLDCSYILGYELGKTSGAQHRIRGYLEYHDGQSVEGQFSTRRSNYLAIKLLYGY